MDSTGMVATELLGLDLPADTTDLDIGDELGLDFTLLPELLSKDLPSLPQCLGSATRQPASAWTP
ncbi:hypothetical protein HaLaN_00613 [Haematococcus lacustris]|uniref:Uncharacterized protein n=1 Tax=Haematococcus lacustris TaxID=44745 RepID=A0A699YJD9_HAELA|nr:hypothetical protein HaLaN_00613 [Haematococcus lacustris]